MNPTPSLFGPDGTQTAPPVHPNGPPVYIDALAVCVPNPNWRWKKSCHMFVAPDTDLERLHEFARKLGLRRLWFQAASAMPHYDLTETRRAAAVKAGAVELDRAATVAILRRWRPLTAPKE